MLHEVTEVVNPPVDELSRQRHRKKLLEAAQAYAARGWPVFPLHSPAAAGGWCSCGNGKCDRVGKHPRTPKGFKDATVEPGVIREWWAKWPDANVGIATGVPSGLVVVDIDPRNGGDVAFAEFERHHGVLSSTATATTGGGGKHLFFQRPGGQHKWKKNLAAGVDLKADRGYVVAAPSTHASGGSYAWVDESAAVAAAPAALMLAATRSARAPGATAAPAPAAPQSGVKGMFTDLFNQQLAPMAPERAARYAQAALQGAAAKVAAAPVGKRNDTLNSEAHAVATFFGEGHLDPDAAAAVLVDAARKCGLDDGEIENTLGSAFAAGESKPRVLPMVVASPVPENLTDQGNAERLARLYGDRLRYCSSRKKWLVWNGARGAWEWDEKGTAYRLAVKAIRSLGLDAQRITDLDFRTKAIKHALASEAAPKIEAMISLARHVAPIPVRPDELDADLFLFNCKNGTLDLRTGELRPHDPADLITKVAPATYDPAAACPIWDRFLADVLPSPELRGFVQRAAGYALTGDTSEHAMFILHGKGKNGKSTFVETLYDMLGGYAKHTDPSTFLVKHGEGPRNDIAALVGARLVTTAEVESGKKLAESLVKQITGEDMVTARFLNAEFFSYKPTFKIFMSTNNLPQVQGTDEGIWRRLKAIPFAVTIAPEKQDRGLKKKLKEELSGILNWALQGFAAWRRDGLGEAAEVNEATNIYREEMDPLADFLAETCAMDSKGKEATQALFDAYLRWCMKHDEKHPIGKPRFTDMLRNRGLTPTKVGGHNSQRGWEGITLLATRAKVEEKDKRIEEALKKSGVERIKALAALGEENRAAEAAAKAPQEIAAETSKAA